MTHAIDHTPDAPAEPSLPRGVWHVDPRRSEIGFAVKMLGGLQTVRGVFRTYEGSLTAGPGGATGELTIEAGSLDTAQKRRDRHLRSPDFFDVDRHPRIGFAATGVTPRDGGLTVMGELAVGSSRVGLEIPVTIERSADGTLRLLGTTTVSRAASGLTWNWLGTVSDEAVLHAELTLAAA
jgi:polyisoprenoid-binding protein YceI